MIISECIKSKSKKSVLIKKKYFRLQKKKRIKKSIFREIGEKKHFLENRRNNLNLKVNFPWIKLNP